MPHVPPDIPGQLASKGPMGSLETSRAWLLRRLDGLLSESLRRAPLSALTRARVLAAATCVLLLLNVLYTLSLQPPSDEWIWRAPGGFGSLGMLGALLLLRRVRSTTAPALLLCASMLWGIGFTLVLYWNSYISTHATLMLLPAFGVYLLGPRKGLLLTLLTILLMGIVAPFLHLHFGLTAPPTSPAFLRMLHVASSMALLSIWLLGALHSTAQSGAQEALERTLKELRDTERKLTSLFENTDDMLCSLDAEGRLLIANTAMKQAFAQRFGQEPVIGQRLFAPAPPATQELWAARFRQVLQGERLKLEVEYREGETRVVLETSLSPIRGEDGVPQGIVLLGRDITARKEAETRLGEMHRTLVDVSRQAGMAEIATGVLHNVGNTLNSVNISAHLISDGLRKLRLSGIGRTTRLLHEHSRELGPFFTQDPRGQQLLPYLQALSRELREEQEALMKETVSLTEGIDHIKAIINMQQKHARTVGAMETVSVPQLIDEALRLHAVSFERMSIRIERDFAAVPLIVTDRHRLLQILLNLLNNARQALAGSEPKDKRLRLRVGLAEAGGQLFIEVSDNGQGIAPEHLPRLFTQGFTTKKEGHGFGLHVSALSAAEMNGRLTCASPGVGQGATFTLMLPLAPAEAPAESSGGMSASIR
ncbi:ATP-binding protein [Hyalangium gracile]|uniref:ATP-binding protein n=1 Tax=Hyalangium gracile TaxID=394092 RepID=UPI001CCEFF13|nr:ATP-binding protein [Hyalangium gracile]